MPIKLKVTRPQLAFIPFVRNCATGSLVTVSDEDAVTLIKDGAAERHIAGLDDNVVNWADIPDKPITSSSGDPNSLSVPGTNGQLCQDIANGDLFFYRGGQWEIVGSDFSNDYATLGYVMTDALGSDYFVASTATGVVPVIPVVDNNSRIVVFIPTKTFSVVVGTFFADFYLLPSVAFSSLYNLTITCAGNLMIEFTVTLSALEELVLTSTGGTYITQFSGFYNCLPYLKTILIDNFDLTGASGESKDTFYNALASFNQTTFGVGDAYVDTSSSGGDVSSDSAAARAALIGRGWTIIP